MIKISTHLSKKVPIPGTDYSSQQYGASMEIETSDGESPDTLQQRIRVLYATLARCVDEQIAAAGGGAAVPGSAAPGLPPSRSAPNAGSTRGNGRPSPAAANGNRARPGGCTSAQQRAIAAICRDRDIELPDVLHDCGVAELKQLDIKTASELIDRLKGGEVGAGNRR